jgi:hypothetical protein
MSVSTTVLARDFRNEQVIRTNRTNMIEHI